MKVNIADVIKYSMHESSRDGNIFLMFCTRAQNAVVMMDVSVTLSTAAQTVGDLGTEVGGESREQQMKWGE